MLPFHLPISRFAPDIVGIGGALTVSTLVTAYTNGIFPWPHEGYPLLWFSPLQRGVLRFDSLHVGERLARTRRKSRLVFTRNRAFAEVVVACRTMPRAHESGTWITDAIEAAYCELHTAGYAQSVEAWNEAGELVGGLYGVLVHGCFSGESMFARERDSSKLALLYLVDCLRETGLEWIDTQMVTPVFAQFGAEAIPRASFLRLLKATQAENRLRLPIS